MLRPRLRVRFMLRIQLRLGKGVEVENRIGAPFVSALDLAVVVLKSCVRVRVLLEDNVGAAVR